MSFSLRPRIREKTGEYMRIQENTEEYRRIQGEYRRIQENTREYKGIQKNTGDTIFWGVPLPPREYRKILGNT